MPHVPGGLSWALLAPPPPGFTALEPWSLLVPTLQSGCDHTSRPVAPQTACRNEGQKWGCICTELIIPSRSCCWKGKGQAVGKPGLSPGWNLGETQHLWM